MNYINLVFELMVYSKLYFLNIPSQYLNRSDHENRATKKTLFIPSAWKTPSKISLIVFYIIIEYVGALYISCIFRLKVEDPMFSILYMNHNSYSTSNEKHDFMNPSTWQKNRFI